MGCRGERERRGREGARFGEEKEGWRDERKKGGGEIGREKGMKKAQNG